MNYHEWIELIEMDPSYIRIGDDKTVDYLEKDSTCVVKNYVPIPVGGISSAINPPDGKTLDDIDDIDIYDEKGDAMGLLVMSRNREIADPVVISDARYAAYINDVDKHLFRQAPYRYANSYFVVNLDRYDEYKQNYMGLAPLWGGFYHERPTSFLPTHKNIPQRITAYAGLTMPQPEHLEKAIRSIDQPFAFERFLNQYHLLEMFSDYQLVENIQSAPSILDGIQLLKKYQSRDFGSELSKLNVVIASRCKRRKNFEAYILEIRREQYYIDKTKEILIDNISDHDPLARIYKSHILRANRDAIDEEILGNIAAKFIYEIRCSIAHSKLGDFFLKSDDERYVVEIIEPLLQEVLRQVFS